MSEWLLLAAVAAAAWYWYSSLRAREQASRAAAEVCRRQQFQFLDETVALQRLSVARNDHGRLALRRTYRFEYSHVGDDRKEGFVIMLGSRIETVGLAA